MLILKGNKLDNDMRFMKISMPCEWKNDPGIYKYTRGWLWPKQGAEGKCRTEVRKVTGCVL